MRKTGIISNEDEIIKLVADGDEGAFTQLFHLYHQKLGAFVYRLTESAPLTQEIVQDIFLKIWLRRSELSKINQFDSYLFVMARNISLNALKQIARERETLRDLESGQVPRYDIEPEFTLLQLYGNLLDEAVEQLPKQQKAVYQMHREMGFSQEAIARKLNISCTTVKKHMGLALRTIRSYIARHAVYPAVILVVYFFS